MKIRNAVGFAVAVPGLLLGPLAVPGGATQREVVTFSGEIEIVADGAPRTLDLCFLTTGATCANGEPSTGVAAGPSIDGSAAGVVDGIQLRVEYAESCGTGGLAPTATASLSGRLHRAGAWGPVVTATWQRTGLVAVVSGAATGIVLVTPVGAVACGEPVPVRITGLVEVLS